MNFVDGACGTCGGATVYTGELPILCKECRVKANNRVNKSVPNLLREHGILGCLITQSMSSQQTNP